MNHDSLISRYDVQLFGETAGADAAGTGGEVPAGQDGAALAQPQQKGVKPSPAFPAAGEPAEAPDAGEQKIPSERAARFEKLIRGEFKDLYDQRVQDTIRRRLKGSEEALRKYQALTPVLEELGRRYGVDAADPEALSRAVRGGEEPAGEDGGSPGKPGDVRDMMARRQLQDWLQQAARTKARYPSFDLQAEAGDPRFRSLLRSGVPLQTAFEVLHQDEILPAAMAFSARKAEEKLAERVLAGQLRPAEGAMGGQSPALSRRDVSQLSRAEREEIDRRVARGEKIRF